MNPLQGQALAALAAMASLEVVSRASGSFETFHKAVRAGRPLHCGPKSVMRPRHGTTVFVNEFALTQPVRRRALLAEAASGSLSEGIKRRLLALLLPWSEVELLVLDVSERAGAAGGKRQSGSSTGAVLLHLEQVNRGRVIDLMKFNRTVLCY